MCPSRLRWTRESPQLAGIGSERLWKTKCWDRWISQFSWRKFKALTGEKRTRFSHQLDQISGMKVYTLKRSHGTRLPASSGPRCLQFGVEFWKCISEWWTDVSMNRIPWCIFRNVYTVYIYIYMCNHMYIIMYLYDNIYIYMYIYI